MFSKLVNLFSLVGCGIQSSVNATYKAEVALARVNGVGKIEGALSAFYVVDELQGSYRGMMIAIPPYLWQDFADMPLVDLADFLQDLAAKLNLKRFLKAPLQKKKKKQPSPQYDPKHPHVSTGKLLSDD